MFIGNINNLMEADKNTKEKRVEKGMKKLSEIKNIIIMLKDIVFLLNLQVNLYSY